MEESRFNERDRIMFFVGLGAGMESIIQVLRREGSDLVDTSEEDVTEIMMRAHAIGLTWILSHEEDIDLDQASKAYEATRTFCQLRPLSEEEVN